MAERILKQVNAPYVINAGDENAGRETVIIHRDGEPFLVLLPYAEYAALITRVSAQPPETADSLTLERERRAYQRLLPGLLRTHPGEWVATVDEQAVEFGPDFATVIARVRQKYGQRPVYVQEILASPRLYKIRTPHLVRQ